MTDKKKLPWMAWDIPAYLADTTSFNAEHHGAYLMLLAAMWMERGSLPDCEEDLAQAARCTPERWAMVRDKVMAKFQRGEDGRLTQKRLSKELSRAGDVSKGRSKAGKEGAAKRWQKDSNGDGKTMANAMANAKQNDAPSQPQPHSPNGEKEIHTARKRAKPSAVVSAEQMVAEGVDPEHARDWLTVRKAKTLPLTPTAWAGVKTEAAAAGMTIAAAIHVAVDHGWGGFKRKWLEEKPPPSTAQTRADRQLATLNGLGTPYHPTGERNGTNRTEPIDVQARVFDVGEATDVVERELHHGQPEGPFGHEDG